MDVFTQQHPSLNRSRTMPDNGFHTLNTAASSTSMHSTTSCAPPSSRPTPRGFGRWRSLRHEKRSISDWKSNIKAGVWPGIGARLSQTDEVDEEFEFDVEESEGRKKRQVVVEQGFEATLCEAGLDRRRRALRHQHHLQQNQQEDQQHIIFSDSETTDAEELEMRQKIDPRSPANYRDTPFIFPGVYTPAPTECTVSDASDVAKEKEKVSDALELRVPEAHTPPQMSYDVEMEKPVKETLQVPMKVRSPPDTPPMTPIDRKVVEEEDDDDEEGGVSMHEASDGEEESEEEEDEEEEDEEEEVVLPRIRPRSTSPMVIGRGSTKTKKKKKRTEEEDSESEEESTSYTRKVVEVPLSIPPGCWRVEVELVPPPPPPPKKGSKSAKYKPKMGGRALSSPVVQHVEIQGPIPRAPRSPRPDLSARTLSTPMIKESEIVPMEVPSPALTIEIPESEEEEEEMVPETVFRAPMWHAEDLKAEGLGVGEVRSASRASSRLDVEIPSPTLNFEEPDQDVEDYMLDSERSPSPKSFVSSVPRRVKAEVPFTEKPVPAITIDVPTSEPLVQPHEIPLPQSPTQPAFEPADIPLPASPVPSFVEVKPKAPISPADIPLPVTPTERPSTPTIDDIIEKTAQKAAPPKTVESQAPHELAPGATPAVITPQPAAAAPATSEPPAPFPEDVIRKFSPPPPPFPEDILENPKPKPAAAAPTTEIPIPSIITTGPDDGTTSSVPIGLGLQLPTSSTSQPVVLPPKRDPRTAPRKPHLCLFSGHLFVTHQSPQNVTCSRCQKKKPKKAWQCLVSGRCGIVVCDDCKKDSVTKVVDVKEEDRVVVKEETEIVWGRWEGDTVFVMGRVPVKKRKERRKKAVVEREEMEAAVAGEVGMTMVNVGDGKGSLRKKAASKWKL